MFILLESQMQFAIALVGLFAALAAGQGGIGSPIRSEINGANNRCAGRQACIDCVGGQTTGFIDRYRACERQFSAIERASCESTEITVFRQSTGRC
ncbi:hypothetical protein FDECE_8528 [Fusarium decemcellulare]|nr:hypothetical protein FDECE_8528 [Fusarium decemcellulare]